MWQAIQEMNGRMHVGLASGGFVRQLDDLMPHGGRIVARQGATARAALRRTAIGHAPTRFDWIESLLMSFVIGLSPSPRILHIWQGSEDGKTGGQGDREPIFVEVAAGQV